MNSDLFSEAPSEIKQPPQPEPQPQVRDLVPRSPKFETSHKGVAMLSSYFAKRKEHDAKLRDLTRSNSSLSLFSDAHDPLSPPSQPKSYL